MPNTLPVHEQFYSFQGEGCHAGRAAYFIRTFGCPVHCPWCDSAGTWHPDYIPEKIARIDTEALAKAAKATKAEFVVVTGGEPTIHDLNPLTDALHRAGLAVHLETSGAFPIKGSFDWITLSPKRWKLPLAENLDRADELKIIVDSESAIEEYAELKRKSSSGTQSGEVNEGAILPEAHRRDPSSPQLRRTGACATTPIWLHPEWSQHRNPQLLNTITEWIKNHGAPYRAGWQQHKNYAADLLDTRSAPQAPLGGDPGKGF